MRTPRALAAVLVPLVAVLVAAPPAPAARARPPHGAANPANAAHGAANAAHGAANPANPANGAANPANPANATPAGTPSADTAIGRALTAAWSTYRAWGRVDDELRWAPWLCRMPMPSAARESRAAQDTPHGHKVFFVYASDRDAYLRTTRADAHAHASAPIGTVVVKESFHPRELAHDDGGPAFRLDDIPTQGAPFRFRALSRDGHWVGPGTFAGLYVLAKTGARGSDHGWEYGTLSPSGQVTAAGQVASCIGCHEDAPHDRLFGLDGGFD